MPKTLQFAVELIDDHADMVLHGGFLMCVPLALGEGMETAVALRSGLKCLAQNLVSFEHLRKGFVDSMPAGNESAELYVKLLDSVIALNATNLKRMETALLVLDRAAIIQCVPDDETKGRKN